MVQIVNLKNVQLRALACGGCSGSSSDGSVRPDRVEIKAEALAAQKAQEQ